MGGFVYSREKLRRAMLLYAVTDRTWLRGRTLPECVADVLAGGVTFVQLREKNASSKEIAGFARAVMPLCRRAGVPFVIDDEVEIALAVGADGVHVGQGDTACADARAVLGPDKIVGVSVQTVTQALAAEAAGADYLGVGAMLATPTKPDAATVSPGELRAICQAASIPVVAIGGLNADTMDVLAGTGVDGAAVVSALFAAEDPQVAARAFVQRIRSVLAMLE